MNVRPVGVASFHSHRGIDGWTDRKTNVTKIIVAFRNFAKAPKKCTSKIVSKRLSVTCHAGTEGE